MKLGRNGTLANIASQSSAAGHAQVKTGIRVVEPPTGQIVVLGNNLAGYVESQSGRRVVFMIIAGNVLIATPDAFEAITANQARMVVAIQQTFLVTSSSGAGSRQARHPCRTTAPSGTTAFRNG